MAVLLREEPRCLGHRPLELHDVDLADGGMLRDGPDGDAAAQTDHENALRSRMQKHGQVTEHELGRACPGRCWRPPSRPPSATSCGAVRSTETVELMPFPVEGSLLAKAAPGGNVAPGRHRG